MRRRLTAVVRLQTGELQPHGSRIFLGSSIRLVICWSHLCIWSSNACYMTIVITSVLQIHSYSFIYIAFSLIGPTLEKPWGVFSQFHLYKMAMMYQSICLLFIIWRSFPHSSCCINVRCYFQALTAYYPVLFHTGIVTATAAVLKYNIMPNGVLRLFGFDCIKFRRCCFLINGAAIMSWSGWSLGTSYHFEQMRWV